MRPKDFEQAVLELAMTTRVPLTRANIVFYSGAAAKQADKWLDDMLRAGLLEFDSDDAGELIYTVAGAERPASGATRLTKCSACGRATGAGARCTRCGKLLDPQMRALKDEVDRGASALRLARRGADLGSLLKPVGEGEKSPVVGGALGLLGPLGWLYAAPLREALPAALVFMILLKLPALLAAPILMLALPASVIAGVLYSWKYNRTGRRSGLFSEDDAGKP